MFSKIDINGFALRILTLACYFLPFVFFFSTCVDGVSKHAYNTKDAIAHEREKTILERRDLLRTATNFFSDNINVTDSSTELSSETIKMLQNNGNNWYFFPSITSLSGLGAAWSFKNGLGQVLIIISILLSFFTLVLWRLWRRKEKTVFILGLNALLVFSFVIVCLSSNVSVLYGTWVLLFLLLVQLLAEIKFRRNKINTTLEGINPN